jgi:hypothetical protein
MTETATAEQPPITIRSPFSASNLILASVYGLLLGLPWGAMLASQYITSDRLWQRRFPPLLAILIATVPLFRRTRVARLLLLLPVFFVLNVAAAYGAILAIRRFLGL